MLFFLPTFRHGVHPEEHKEPTAALPIQRMPFVDRYFVPLSQHIGAPSELEVDVGQRVQRGQRLASPGGFVSVALHAPVTGVVERIGPHRHPNGQFVPTIEIAADPYATQTWEPAPVDPAALSSEEFVAEVQGAGIVGLGGAAFPAHVKYALPEGRTCEHLVINGCECEPFLTCDHRVMVERADQVLEGVRILMEKIPADRAVIGIEANKPDAVARLSELAAAHPRVRVAPLTVKYPQGAEKMLIHAVFGREVPAGKLPLDLGMIVNNVSTVAALAAYFRTGMPLIERVLTVSGPGVARPANLIVPIGTPIRAVMEHCGLDHDVQQVLMGGPMMGQPIASLDVPVVKGTSGLLAFTSRAIAERNEYPCVRCGRCLEACPNYLNPSQLARLARSGDYQRALDEFHLMDCVECGACTFVCPSSIPIVQLLKMSKNFVRTRGKPS